MEMHEYRTHTCGELRKSHVGNSQRVRISGWLHRKRDHGGLLFLDLRDHYGITQCVVEPDHEAFKKVEPVRAESVLTITGRVVARTADTINPELPTGEIEVRIEDAAVQGAAEELPIPVFGDIDYPEETRLKYRFLDLRRDQLHSNIMLRSNVIASIRRRMIAAGFFEFQTPILTASSPEGARDFLVPSRLHPGKFYALPQAPQQFKQLIMVAGFDRYFQIAPCFRDEDPRADRSPGEFYQLDVEMSFVTQEEVWATIEPVIHGVFEEFSGYGGVKKKVTPAPFPRLTYAESLLKYGSDKPDMRNPIQCSDVTAFFAEESVSFNAFKNVIKAGGTVRAIPAPGAAAQPRSFFDKLNEWARKDMRAPGLGYIVFENEGGKPVGKGPIAKFVPEDVQARMAHHAGVKAGDTLFFSAGKEADAVKLAGAARNKIGEEQGLVEENAFRLCWVWDYPMYEWNEDEQKIDFSHNPFSMPDCNRSEFLELDPDDKAKVLAVKARQYDIVCNGVELCSGAIRNHWPDVMLKAFEIAGHARDSIEARFGGMLNAFRYGAPPHGGLAPGIDRMVMLLAGASNLRDVIMFPMNQQAQDLMMGAPSEVLPRQLRELHLKLVEPPKKEQTAKT